MKIRCSLCLLIWYVCLAICVKSDEHQYPRAKNSHPSGTFGDIHVPPDGGNPWGECVDEECTNEPITDGTPVKENNTIDVVTSPVPEPTTLESTGGCHCRSESLSGVEDDITTCTCYGESIKSIPQNLRPSVRRL